MASSEVAALRPVFAIMDLLLGATNEQLLVDALLPALRCAVPSDSVVWTRRSARTVLVYSDPSGLLSEVQLAEFDTHAGLDPPVVHTRCGGGVATWSGLPSERALGSNATVFRPVGARRQLAMSFAAGPGRSVCVAFKRAGRDYTDVDRDLAECLRPLLATTLTRLAPPAPPSRITRREAEVLDLLGLGLADQQIASRLGISPRTVGKHLEHIYCKLGERGRLRTVTHLRGAG